MKREYWNEDTLAIYSDDLNSDGEPQLLATGTVEKRKLSTDHLYIDARIVVHPHCEPSEVKNITNILLAHLTERLNA